MRDLTPPKWSSDAALEKVFAQWVPGQLDDRRARRDGARSKRRRLLAVLAVR